MRDGFIFYESFRDATRKAGDETRLKLYEALMDYALYDIEPEFDDDIAYGFFKLIKPQIDANIRKRDNGKKGGRPLKPETETKPPDNLDETKGKPTHNQSETKPKPADNQSGSESKPSNNLSETKGKPNAKAKGNANANVNANANKNSCPPAADVRDFFESIWTQLPRKEGKGQVSEAQKRKLYQIGHDHICRAIQRYKLAKAGTERKYLQMGSTFLNNGYVDYLDENYEKGALTDGRNNANRGGSGKASPRLDADDRGSWESFKPSTGFKCADEEQNDDDPAG